MPDPQKPSVSSEPQTEEALARKIAEHLTEGIYDMPAIETRAEFLEALTSGILFAIQGHTRTAVAEAVAQVGPSWAQRHEAGVRAAVERELREVAKRRCESCRVGWGGDPLFDPQDVRIMFGWTHLIDHGKEGHESKRCSIPEVWDRLRETGAQGTPQTPKSGPV